MSSILTKTLHAVAVLTCLWLSVPQLVRHVDWTGYTAFTAEVTGGRRIEPADMALLAPVLDRTRVAPCDVLRNTPLVTLHLYANDLLARQAGVNPLLTADDEALRAQRVAARAVLEDALACSPLDGNLWLSLAIMSRALGDDAATTAHYLAMSAEYTPHEGWIARRRDQLF
ncbi:MAG: hypothetical protein GVY34_13300 [Alphaproteobacteria bacterium]|jgi:hypothetical protein|nr:hypothetical protein [Alphaproteobacteria bacterium]